MRRPIRLAHLRLLYWIGTAPWPQNVQPVYLFLSLPWISAYAAVTQAPKCIGLADVFPTTAGHLLINAGIEEEQPRELPVTHEAVLN
jgi:hypothetical protein